MLLIFTDLPQVKINCRWNFQIVQYLGILVIDFVSSCLQPACCLSTTRWGPVSATRSRTTPSPPTWRRSPRTCSLSSRPFSAPSQNSRYGDYLLGFLSRFMEILQQGGHNFYFIIFVRTTFWGTTFCYRYRWNVVPYTDKVWWRNSN